MSIYLRTGQPGHGKSYGAVRVIRDSLEAGLWVATNIELHDGWALTMAKTNWFRRIIPGRCAKVAAAYESRIYITHSLDEFSRLRLPPCGKCQPCKAGRRCRAEGRGRMVLDEAHNWLNARTWDADESGQALTKAEAVQNRLKIVRLFSQHRKLGWHVDLITQDDANLDRQVRSLFEYHVHLKNLRRFKLFGILPIVPVNVFVAVTTWHDNEKSRLGVESFLLNKRLASCYDTTATSHGLAADGPDSIYLGQVPPDGEPAARGVARPPAIPPPPLPAFAGTLDTAAHSRDGWLVSSAPLPLDAGSTPPLDGGLPSDPSEVESNLGAPVSALSRPLNAETPPLAPATSPATQSDWTARNGYSATE